MIKRLLSAALIVCFFSCSKTTDCPSYPGDLLEWLPYGTDEKITFRSGQQEQTFIFSDVFSTKRFTTGRTEACNCDAFAHTNSSVDSVGNIQMLCSSEKKKVRFEFMYEFQHYGKHSSYYVPLNIDRFMFSIKNDGTVEGTNSIDAALRDSVMIDSKLFNNVIVVEIDTIVDTKAEIFRLYLVKGRGVAKYEYKSGKAFTLTDL